MNQQEHDQYHQHVDEGHGALPQRNGVEAWRRSGHEAGEWPVARVRPLDEPRMRAALEGDRQAQMLAFGEAIEA